MSEKTDIVEHFGRFVAARRQQRNGEHSAIMEIAAHGHGEFVLTTEDLERAAAEIARLRAVNAELVAALTMMLDLHDAHARAAGVDPDSYIPAVGARAALASVSRGKE